MSKLIVLGGVPGAGKSTTLRRLPRAGRDGVLGTDDDLRVLDPDDLAVACRDVLPTWVPYALYRPLVHGGHGLRVVGHLLVGAVLGRREHPVVVHDPATRGWRRRALTGLARWCGYSPELVLISVSTSEALQGQQLRRRTLSAQANHRHWDGHRRLRARLDRAIDQDRGGADEDWAAVHHTDRAGVGALLRSLVDPSPTAPAHRPPEHDAHARAATTTRTRSRRTPRRSRT